MLTNIPRSVLQQQEQMLCPINCIFFSSQTSLSSFKMSNSHNVQREMLDELPVAKPTDVIPMQQRTS